ncbi:unnamed protein product [Eretmochelys imbricata]
MQKDASCRESPLLIAKHLPLHDLMPFSFTLLVGLLEKGECADQLVGVMEAVLREKESELQGQVQDLHAALSYTLCPPRGGQLSEGTRDILHLLARQHTKAAVSILLQMPWPYERPHAACGSWSGPWVKRTPWRDSRTTCSPLASSPSPASQHGTSREPSTSCPVTPVPAAWPRRPWRGCCSSGAVSRLWR